MKKYKLNKEEQHISKDDLAKYKDFSRFKANYEEVTKNRHKVPLYKNPKMFLALVIVVLIVYLLTKGDNDEVNNQLPQQQDTIQVD